MSGRCECCDKILTPYEMTLRDAEEPHDFMNTCSACLDEVFGGDVEDKTIGRQDLETWGISVNSGEGFLDDEYDLIDALYTDYN